MERTVFRICSIRILARESSCRLWGYGPMTTQQTRKLAVSCIAVHLTLQQISAWSPKDSRGHRLQFSKIARDILKTVTAEEH